MGSDILNRPERRPGNEARILYSVAFPLHTVSDPNHSCKPDPTKPGADRFQYHTRGQWEGRETRLYQVKLYTSHKQSHLFTPPTCPVGDEFLRSECVTLNAGQLFSSGWSWRQGLVMWLCCTGRLYKCWKSFFNTTHSFVMTNNTLPAVFSSMSFSLALTRSAGVWNKWHKLCIIHSEVNMYTSDIPCPYIQESPLTSPYTIQYHST